MTNKKWLITQIFELPQITGCCPGSTRPAGQEYNYDFKFIDHDLFGKYISNFLNH